MTQLSVSVPLFLPSPPASSTQVRDMRTSFDIGQLRFKVRSVSVTVSSMNTYNRTAPYAVAYAVAYAVGQEKEGEGRTGVEEFEMGSRDRPHELNGRSIRTIFLVAC